MSGFQVRKCLLSLNDPACTTGISNVTPNLLSDGGQDFCPEDAVVHALEMQEQSTGMIDVGGQPTRPGFTVIPPQEEWGRIEPVLKVPQRRLNVPVFVDTSYPQVASMALSAGADMTNNVGGFTDPATSPAVLQGGCGRVIMHNGHVLGEDPEEDTLFRVWHFLEGKLRQAQEIGIAWERICFDSGVGFGKTYEGNLHLIVNVDAAHIESCAFLIAASRKSVIGEDCDGSLAEDRMPGTLMVHTLAQVGSA